VEKHITHLKQNQIFIFGSNGLGKHIGGAARQAFEKFGAQMGVSEGWCGQAYAFPTLNKHFQKCSMRQLRASRDRLFKVCEQNPEYEFLLTKIGCGIAGFKDAEIKPLFDVHPINLTMPIEWQEKEI